MISKKGFSDLMFALKTQHQEDELISQKLTSILDKDFFGAIFTTRSNQAILRVLTEEMNDRWGHINYFIYEADWGRKADEFYITEKDGEVYKFKHPDDVYDYIVREDSAPTEYQEEKK